MSRVLAWPRHVLHGGRQHRCSCPADFICMVCEGGLALCVVCGGAEAGLPACCPGEPMHEVLCEEVAAGALDYDARRGWYQKGEQRRRA